MTRGCSSIPPSGQSTFATAVQSCLGCLQTIWCDVIRFWALDNRLARLALEFGICYLVSKE